MSWWRWWCVAVVPVQAREVWLTPAPALFRALRSLKDGGEGRLGIIWLCGPSSLIHRPYWRCEVSTIYYYVLSITMQQLWPWVWCEYCKDSGAALAVEGMSAGWVRYGAVGSLEYKGGREAKGKARQVQIRTYNTVLGSVYKQAFLGG